MNPDSLLKRIGDLRYHNKDFLTNAYFSTEKIISLVNSENTKVFSTENVIIFLVEEENLIRLYFYILNLGSIGQIPRLIPNMVHKPIVTDIIGKKPYVELIVSELEKFNFVKYSELMRMLRSSNTLTLENQSDIFYAKNDEVHEIKNILYNNFDILISHLPNLLQISKAISEKQIIVIRDHNKIIAFAYFEKIGERLKYLYQIVVHRDYRGKGLADKLLKFAFSTSSRDTGFLLWVETKNTPAISLYKKNHFEPDGLMDFVMLYQGN